MIVFKNLKPGSQFFTNVLPAAAVFHHDPEIGIFKVGAVIFDDVFGVALLHDADLFDDFLKVGLDGNLFDGKNLKRYGD